MKTVEVISLIYRSTKYFDFIMDQYVRHCPSTSKYQTSFRFVANNPTQRLIDYAKLQTNVRTDIFLSDPAAHYINRVYMAYNFAVMTSQADYVCLVNSDEGFSPGWLDNLFKWVASHRVIAASRLVESGKLKSGEHGIERYFGNSPENYQELDFINYVGQISRPNVAAKRGLYMPLLVQRELFLKAGGFPPGNICSDGVGGNGKVLMAGDDYFFHEVLEKKYGVAHITPLDSIVYHFQEGEKDE